MENLGNNKEEMALRNELERSVVSTNICLRETVKGMNHIALLRNVHPLVRLDFAYKLRDLKMIEPSAVKEFLTPVDPLTGRFGR